MRSTRNREEHESTTSFSNAFKTRCEFSINFKPHLIFNVPRLHQLFLIACFRHLAIGLISNAPDHPADGRICSLVSLPRSSLSKTTDLVPTHRMVPQTSPLQVPLFHSLGVDEPASRQIRETYLYQDLFLSTQPQTSCVFPEVL